MTMSRVRSRDTKPEMVVRKGLHALGHRYRLHDSRLPGTPDLVFPTARVVIFVHGCFWHGHDCRLGVRPKSNAPFWDAKIARNRERDGFADAALLAAGWRVGAVWECALRGTGRLPTEDVLARLSAFVTRGEPKRMDVTGTAADPR